MNTFLTALISIGVFGFITSVTPGPNNTFLLSSGANFGVRKSLSYVNGIMAGLVITFSAMYLGVGTLFDNFPIIQEVMKYAGFAYILYMAYGIIRSQFVHRHEEVERIGFLRSTAFQLVNPKAWIVLMMVVATYIPAKSTPVEVVSLLAVFLITTYPGAVIWAGFGELMATLLAKPTYRRIFNISAAVLLVISMIPVLFL